MIERPTNKDIGRELGATADSDAFTGDLFAWLNAVRSDHELPALGFVVAYTIGQHFDRDTRVGWPGQPRIAELVGRDERSVRPVIKALIARGHLIVAKNRGGGGSTHYRMPTVNRTKTSGSDDDTRSADRTKPSGSTQSEAIANRTKPSGSRSVNRKKSVVQTGRKLPPNHSIEPFKESAAPQPPRAGGEPAFDGVTDRADFGVRPEVAAEIQQRRALDRVWRGLVGSEPVLTDMDTTALHVLLAEGVVTAADVETGIREAMAKPGWRLARWHQLVGWARNAARQRLAKDPKAEAAAAPSNTAGLIRLEGGVMRSRAFLEAEIAKWHDGFAWDASLGFPPDDPYTTVPDDMRGPRRPSTAPTGRRPVLAEGE